MITQPPTSSFIAVTATQYLWLGAVAFGAGMLNAVAGGGSFFSFPALLGVHLPPVNANATNTVALWPGQLTAIYAFRRELEMVKRLILPCIIAAVVGGYAGAQTLLHTKQSTFMHLVPWLLLLGTLMFAFGTHVRKSIERWRAKRNSTPSRASSFSFPLFFWLMLVCFYVGYFGAGAGFLILTVFTVTSNLESIHQANALKNLANTFANGTAVLTFIAAGAVYWKEGLFMMVLAAIGGYFGAAYSRKVDPKYVRAVVIIGGLAISIYFFIKLW